MDAPVEHPAIAIQRIGMAQPASAPAGRFWSLDSPEVVLLQIDELAQGGQYVTRRVAVGEAGVVKDFLQRICPGRTCPRKSMRGREIPLDVHPALKMLSKQDTEAYALFEQYGRSKAPLRRQRGQSLGRFVSAHAEDGFDSADHHLVDHRHHRVGGKPSGLGKMFGRTILYYLSTSLLAIFVGLMMVKHYSPWCGQRSKCSRARGSRSSWRGAEPDDAAL